jgi:hypothetical protein
LKSEFFKLIQVHQVYTIVIPFWEREMNGKFLPYNNANKKWSQYWKKF